MRISHPGRLFANADSVYRPAEPAIPEEPTEPPTKEPEPPVPEAAIVEPVETAEVENKSFEPEPDTTITPSKDELTETNLEQILDTSNPALTATAASTAASSWDPRSAVSSSTPYSALQQGQPQAIRPPTSGFQASALKATGSSARTPSYQRRVLDQEEAVRMPGNREVDRAAVQFGAFNLNGSGDEDVDGDREEAETRAQPPQHSPIAPRATLPPVPAPQQPAASVPETFPTPKQSAGLPAAATHPTGKQLFKCLKNDKTDVQSAAPGLPSPAPLPNAPGKLPQVPFLKLLLIINKAHLSKDLKETISASTADMDNPVPKSHHHCPKSHTTLSANRPHLPKVPSKATTTNNPSPNRNSHNLELSLPHPMSSPLITPRIPNNVKPIIAITTNSMDCRAHKASKMDLPLSSDPTADTMVPRAKDHLNSHRALPSKPNHAMPLLEKVKTAATPLQTRPPKANNLLLAKVLNHSLATHNSRSATTHTATPTTLAHTMLNT